MTIYLVLASFVYGWTALALAASDPPETFRDAAGAALICVTVAMMWPVTITWRVLVGPLPAT